MFKHEYPYMFMNNHEYYFSKRLGMRLDNSGLHLMWATPIIIKNDK